MIIFERMRELTDEQIIEIFNLRNEYKLSNEKISKVMGISKNNVASILTKNEKYKEDPNFIASVTGAVYDNQQVSVLKEILTNLYAERKINKTKHLEIERKFSKLKK